MTVSGTSNRESLVMPAVCLLIVGGCINLPGITPPADGDTIAENITAAQAHDLIQENLTNDDFVILDVRTAGEFAGGHIENAVNMDYYGQSFESDLDALDKGKTYLIYCQSSGRSSAAMVIMGNLGFVEVYNMIGGMGAWNAAGFPTVQ